MAGLRAQPVGACVLKPRHLAHAVLLGGNGALLAAVRLGGQPGVLHRRGGTTNGHKGPGSDDKRSFHGTKPNAPGHAREVLGWVPRPPRQAITTTARDLMALGVVRP